MTSTNVVAVDSLRTKVEQDATRIVNESLLGKIESLNQIYLSCKAVSNVYNTISVDLSEQVSINGAVKGAIDILKKEVKDMLIDLSSLKLWIRLNMPRMEDGNNFGVEVQEEVLGMINGLYSSGLSFLKNLSGYYFKRGKLISKIRKQPHIEDFLAGAEDIDEKQYSNLVQSCCDLRNNYAFLYDKIIKNQEKLIKPKGRSNAAGAMY